MGGVEVGDEETAGSGGDGFAQAKFGSSMAPTGPVFVFGWSVLPVRDEKIGFLGKLGEGAWRRGGRLMVGCKDKGAFLFGRDPINSVGEATARMGEGGGSNEERIRAGGQFQIMVGLNFMEGDVSAELGKSGGKERFALLGVEGSFDQVAGVGTGKTRRVDRDLNLGLKGGGKKGKSLQMVPVGVGEEKGEGAAALGGPVEACLAQTRAGVENQKVVFGPLQAEAGAIPAELLGGNGGGGRGRDASAGSPEVELHRASFWTGRRRARSRIFLFPTLRRSIR